ncbi:unnamed protein product [Larinioides sclopetarius]
MEELIGALSEVDHLPDPLPILTAVSTAVPQAFLFTLHRLKNALSVKLVHFFESELSKFCEWLDQLNLEQDKKLKLKNSQCLIKVKAILKCILVPVSRSSIFSARLNRIVPITDTGPQVSEDVLTDQEKYYWQSTSSRNFLSSSLC